MRLLWRAASIPFPQLGVTEIGSNHRPESSLLLPVASIQKRKSIQSKSNLLIQIWLLLYCKRNALHSLELICFQSLFQSATLQHRGALAMYFRDEVNFSFVLPRSAKLNGQHSSKFSAYVTNTAHQSVLHYHDLSCRRGKTGHVTASSSRPFHPQHFLFFFTCRPFLEDHFLAIIPVNATAITPQTLALQPTSSPNYLRSISEKEMVCWDGAPCGSLGLGLACGTVETGQGRGDRVGNCLRMMSHTAQSHGIINKESSPF